MPAEHDDPDLSRFSSVDSAGRPEALIAWLDTAELAQRLPPRGTATGIDAGDTMIDEARRRTAHLGRSIVFDIGDAASLPQWWSPLGQQATSGDVLAGATLILVVASKP